MKHDLILMILIRRAGAVSIIHTQQRDDAISNPK